MKISITITIFVVLIIILIAAWLSAVPVYSLDGECVKVICFDGSVHECDFDCSTLIKGKSECSALYVDPKESESGYAKWCACMGGTVYNDERGYGCDVSGGTIKRVLAGECVDHKGNTVPCPKTSGKVSSKDEVQSIHGEIECRLGPHWVGRSDWLSPYPLYAFVSPSSGLWPTISVEKYTVGNRLHPKAEDYIMHMRTLQGARLIGTKHVAGRKRELYEMTYEDSKLMFDTQEHSTVTVREQFVILELPKFFIVIKLRAPANRFDELIGEFRDCLESFRLLKR